MRLQPSRDFPGPYSLGEHVNLVKFYFTHCKGEMFSKQISSMHGGTKRKDTGIRRVMEVHLQTDKAASKVLHLSNVMKNQETCFQLSWMPITIVGEQKEACIFETSVFCLSEMGSLSEWTGDETAGRTEAAFGDKCPLWVSSRTGSVNTMITYSLIALGLLV